jgi:hypothetical protein
MDFSHRYFPANFKREEQQEEQQRNKMDELEQVKKDIAEAKEDLRRAKERNNEELELKIRDSLNLLLKKEERLTSSSGD